MARMPICNWCDIKVSENVFINYPANDKMKNSFCSEKCFELSRRASFKRGKACDWCEKISATEAGCKSVNDYGTLSKAASMKAKPIDSLEDGAIGSVEQLHFCNNACLMNYKKTVFEKETSDVLQVKKEEFIGDIDVESVTVSKNSEEKKTGIGIKSISSIKSMKNNGNPSLKKSRCSSFTKFHKSNKRIFSTDSSTGSQITNISLHNIKPMFHSFSSYADFLKSRQIPSISSFNLPTKSTESVKIPVSTPLYIPVPIPIPIPIFKNAPEIIDILYKYGYRQTQNTKENSNLPKSPIGIINKIGTGNSEPQTEALDLSGSGETRIESSQNSINMTNSFPITSILHLNDPYLKRRNRILDAPTPQNFNGFNYSTRMKNYGLNYAELSTSAQLKSNRYSKKKLDKTPNYHKSSNSKTQSPRPLIQATKSLLKRYPLISLRRNIKSAPSSVIDSNVK